MAIGNGNTGKTTFLRWLAETTLARGGEPIFAAVDPENRELRDYFEGVHEPPSYDPAKVAKWLEDLFAHAMETKASACIDFGGGDTTLGRLVADSPDIVSVLEDAGISPVAFYFLSPRLADLSPLASLEGAGFKPRATGLVQPVRSDAAARAGVRPNDAALGVQGGGGTRRCSALDAAPFAREGGRGPPRQVRPGTPMQRSRRAAA